MQVIINSGYLPPESPLRTAQEKGELFGNGKKISVQAEVRQIELSGHADQLELVRMVEELKPERTILVHGDIEQAQALSEEIEEMTEVWVPEKGETIAM